MCGLYRRRLARGPELLARKPIGPGPRLPDIDGPGGYRLSLVRRLSKEPTLQRKLPIASRRYRVAFRSSNALRRFGSSLTVNRSATLRPNVSGIAASTTRSAVCRFQLRLPVPTVAGLPDAPSLSSSRRHYRCRSWLCDGVRWLVAYLSDTQRLSRDRESRQRKTTNLSTGCDVKWWKSRRTNGE